MKIKLLTGVMNLKMAIANSPIATGTKKLIGDLTTFLLVVAPLAGIACVIFFFIRRSMADEMDQKKWNNRITTAIISTIGAVLGATILNLVLGYYA